MVPVAGGFDGISLEPGTTAGFVATVMSDLEVKAGSVGKCKIWRTEIFIIVSRLSSRGEWT